MPVDTLRIKKYPNRRLYDQTNSRHLTRDELYDLVAGGAAVEVTDSRTGQDITNAVLLQVLVDRDPASLAAIPTVLMHLLVQGNELLVARLLERTLGWLAEASREASRPFEEWMRMTRAAMGGTGARGRETGAAVGGAAESMPRRAGDAGVSGLPAVPGLPPTTEPVHPFDPSGVFRGRGEAANASGGASDDDAASPSAEAEEDAARIAELQARIRDLEGRLRRLESSDDAD